MSALDQLLRSFDREGVEEISLTSETVAYAMVDGVLEALNDDVWSTDALLAALVAFGGSRHVEELSETPRHWTSRVAGLGTVSVEVTQRGPQVEARFQLQRRESKSMPPVDSRPAGHITQQFPRPVLPAGGPPPFPASRASLPHIQPPLPPVVSMPAPPPPLTTQSVRLRIDTPTNIQPVLPRPSVPAAEEVEAAVSVDIDLLPLEQAPSPPPSRPFPVPAPPSQPSLRASVPPSSVPPPSFAAAQAVPAPPPAPAPPAPPPPSSLVSAPLPPAPLPHLPVAVGSLPPVPLPPPVITSMPGVTVPVPARVMTAPPPPPASLQTLLANARVAFASDLHVIAGRPPLFRVAGELRPNGPVLSPEQVEKMIAPYVPDELGPRLEHDGACAFSITDRTQGRLRVHVSRQQSGYKASFRILSKELPTVESLRLPEALVSAARHRHGIILLTGPLGHGKSTTLHALVDLLNRSRARHIVTVEDPIEYLHPRKLALISQREVGTHTRSLVSGLEAALREDADVLVVGELRELPEVRLALSAAETGQLVLATMSTPSAARTLERMMALFPPNEQPSARLSLSTSLRLLVNQRLVASRDGRGLLAAFEVVPGSPSLSARIREGEADILAGLAPRGNGMGAVLLPEALARLVSEERVSLEATRGLLENTGEVEAVLRGSRPF